MNNRSAILMAVGACGVGFLAAWLIFRSDGTCKIDDASLPREPRGLQRDTQENPVHPKPAILERPDSRVPALTETSTASELPQSPQPTANPQPITPGDPRSLSETTLGEMIWKRDAIKSYLTALKMPIIEQRHKDGLFEHLSDTPSNATSIGLARP